MNRIFDDATDLLNTMTVTQEQETIALNLGRGDGTALEASGLMERNNASQNSAFEIRKRKEKNKAVLTALELALQNAEYRQRYNAVWQKIDDTQEALDVAILENVEHIEALEDNAMRTEEGRMTFITDDGFVYTDGTAVAKQDEPSPSDVHKDATRWQDYRVATDRRDQLARIQTDTLDPIRKRMSDPDNPLDRPTLDDFDRQLENADKIIAATPDKVVDVEMHAERDATTQLTSILHLPSPVG